MKVLSEQGREGLRPHRRGRSAMSGAPTLCPAGLAGRSPVPSAAGKRDEDGGEHWSAGFRLRRPGREGCRGAPEVWDEGAGAVCPGEEHGVGRGSRESSVLSR